MLEIHVQVRPRCGWENNIEQKVSLPCSEDPITGFSPERDESNPHPPTVLP